MRILVQMLFLSWADYTREKLHSICAVCGLAALLAPLLVLYGVKFGIVTTLTERMRSDPVTLEITPAASGRYQKDRFDTLRAHPDVAFVLPRTRSIAATMQLSTIPKEGEDRKKIHASLEPTGQGDPVLLRWGTAIPEILPYEGEKKQAKTEEKGKGLSLKQSDASLRLSGVVLSESAAQKLHVKTGDFLIGRVERSYSGIISSARLRLEIKGVLPAAAGQKDTAYIPLSVLEATEDFRDGRAVPLLGEENGWTGEPQPEEARIYSSFRLYASSLEAVGRLRIDFAQQGIETYTHADEIARIEGLNRVLTGIFSLICLIAAIGFFVSTGSNVLASVKRKARTLGLLKLSGFSTSAIILYPIYQSLLTAFFGTVLASFGYFGIASAINYFLRDSLGMFEQACALLPLHFAVTLGLVTALSLFAALFPSVRGAAVEPSEVIRDE